jgi:hypothetical protein
VEVVVDQPTGWDMEADHTRFEFLATAIKALPAMLKKAKKTYK